MSLDSFNDQCIEANVVKSYIKFTGAAASPAPPTKVFGRGLAITHPSAGVYNLVWDENPGMYMGVMGWAFEATAQSALKGFTVVAGVYNATTRTLVLNVTNAAELLTSLVTAQQLSITIGFKRTNA